MSSPAGEASRRPLRRPATMRIGSRRLLLRERMPVIRVLRPVMRLGTRPPALVRALGPPELLTQHLGLHLLDLALLQMAELEGAIGDADEAADGIAQMLTDAADLAVLALGQ